MEKLDKENMIKSIQSRIEAEYMKHKKLDWAQIAAIKIVSNIEYYYDVNKKKDVD